MRSKKIYLCKSCSTKVEKMEKGTIFSRKYPYWCMHCSAPLKKTMVCEMSFSRIAQ